MSEGLIVRPLPDMRPVASLTKRHKDLESVMRDLMRPGVDYGRVGDSKKPVLLKAGAEMLCALFELTPDLETEERLDLERETEVEIWEWEGPDGARRRSVRKLVKRGLCEVISICTLRYMGAVVARMSGSANNLERKHLTQSVSDVRNTLRKMSEKRAVVAAVLFATGASRLFSADLDDQVIVSEAEILADRGPAIAFAAADLALAPDAEAVAAIWSKVGPELRPIVAAIRSERLQALGVEPAPAAPEPVCVPDLAAVQADADLELQPLAGEVLSFSAVLATEAPRSVGADTAGKSLDLAWERFAARALHWASKGARVFVHLPRAARTRNLRERYDALAELVNKAEVK